MYLCCVAEHNLPSKEELDASDDTPMQIKYSQCAQEDLALSGSVVLVLNTQLDFLLTMAGTRTINAAQQWKLEWIGIAWNSSCSCYNSRALHLGDKIVSFSKPALLIESLSIENEWFLKNTLVALFKSGEVVFLRQKSNTPSNSLLESQCSNIVGNTQFNFIASLQ